MAKSEKMIIRVENGTRAELQKIADKDDRSLSWVVRKAIVNFLKGSAAVKA